VQYFLRDQAPGNYADAMMQMLFYDQMEKRNGEWRIWKWTAFYNVDRVDPVVPMSEAPGYYKDVNFDGGRNGIEMMRHRGTKTGRPMSDWIVVAGSDKERKVREEGERWFNAQR
jgi:hypothetical protein